VIALGISRAVAAPSDGAKDVDVSEVAARLQVIFGGRFEVLEPLAIGGMATIFQLRHRLHRGLFVAKVLHSRLAGEPGVIRSFRAEAVHAARLGGHPNAVPVFDFGELDGLFYMTMPFIEGEDLDRLLQRTGALSRTETLNFAAQISSLLSFAETEGIVHCDLTPANFRLDTFGRYRLLDFGISHSEIFSHERSFIAGTPLYTSPEQLRGETPDLRSDLYALGAVLAEMLTGKPLFHAETLDEIDQKHLKGNWQLPFAIAEDKGIAHLLKKLLATRRENRFQSAFELSGALDGLGFSRPEFREHQTLHTAPRSSVQDIRRPRLSSC
jgi:eukaryotic-like serine/threonine-protein kinase